MCAILSLKIYGNGSLGKPGLHRDLPGDRRSPGSIPHPAIRLVPGPAAKTFQIRPGAGQRPPRPAAYRVREGDAVVVSVPEPVPTHLAPEALSLDIVFEDHDLLVVNKPPGLVVHPGAGHRAGTLLNALVHHCPELQDIGEVSRPGLVHRLEKTPAASSWWPRPPWPTPTGGPVPGPRHRQAVSGPGLGPPARGRGRNRPRDRPAPQPAKR